MSFSDIHIPKSCPLDSEFRDCALNKCAFFLNKDQWVGCCIVGFVNALLDEIHKVDQKQP